MIAATLLSLSCLLAAGEPAEGSAVKIKTIERLRGISSDFKSYITSDMVLREWSTDKEVEKIKLDGSGVRPWLIVLNADQVAVLGQVIRGLDSLAPPVAAIYDRKTGDKLRTIGPEDSGWTLANLTPDGEFLVSVSGHDGTCKVTSLRDRKALPEIIGTNHGGIVHVGNHIAMFGQKAAPPPSARPQAGSPPKRQPPAVKQKRQPDPHVQSKPIPPPKGQSVIVYTLDSGRVKQTRSLEVDGTPYSDRIVLSDDGELLGLIGSKRDSVPIYDVSSGKLLATLDHPEVVLLANFHSSNKMIATFDKDRTIRIWKVGGSKPIVTIKDAPFTRDEPGSRLLFSSDGSELLLWYQDRGLSFSRLADRAHCWEIKLPKEKFQQVERPKDGK
jgi:hypothetical protein